jgi:hypothetical protein
MSLSEGTARAPGDTPDVHAKTLRDTASGAQLDEPKQAGVEPLVTILTFCAHPSMAYGTMLIFKTVRVGFPNARIEVFDNGSHPEVVGLIARAAADVGATFQARAPRHYADHYEWLLLEREHDDRPLVLVDPDVIFFGNVWSTGRSAKHWRRVGSSPNSARIALRLVRGSIRASSGCRMWRACVARSLGGTRQTRRGTASGLHPNSPAPHDRCSMTR